MPGTLLCLVMVFLWLIPFTIAIIPIYGHNWISSAFTDSCRMANIWMINYAKPLFYTYSFLCVFLILVKPGLKMYFRFVKVTTYDDNVPFFNKKLHLRVTLFESTFLNIPPFSSAFFNFVANSTLTIPSILYYGQDLAFFGSESGKR